MAIETASWTREELERFPRDGNRYEVLDGELLVTPQAAADHQYVSLRLGVALYHYCNSCDVGLAMGPGAVIFGKNELQPDLEVLPAGLRLRGKKWDALPYPILAVEILSPFSASRARDLDTKRKAYLELGIPVYWVVDLDRRCVHVWSNGRAEMIVTDVLNWRPDPEIAAFQLPLDELFGPAVR